MKYELETLTQLVNSVVRGEEKPAVLQEILKEAERLPRVIMENIFGLQTDYLVRQYICWHQDELVKLADQLYRKAAIVPRKEIKKALVIILNVLNQLGQAFPEHCDSSVPVPQAVLDKERKIYVNDLDTLRLRLEENKINPKLIKVALAPLENYIARRPGKKISYGDYQYIRQYRTGMKELDFGTKDFPARDYVLSNKLISVNYNNLLLLEYCTAEITKYLDKHPTPEGKEKVLTSVKKILNQLPVITGISYDKRFQPIKEALLKWTEEESNFWLSKAEAAGLTAPVPMLKQKLPVAQIALMAALTYRNDVYYEKDKNRIIDHYVHVYASKETEHMSEGSFRNHFNKPTDAAARGLRKLLRKMLDDLDGFLK